MRKPFGLLYIGMGLFLMLGTLCGADEKLGHEMAAEMHSLAPNIYFSMTPAPSVATYIYLAIGFVFLLLGSCLILQD